MSRVSPVGRRDAFIFHTISRLRRVTKNRTLNNFFYVYIYSDVQRQAVSNNHHLREMPLLFTDNPYDLLRL